MNRRAVLAAAPTLGLAGIIPAAANSAIETPVMILFRKWLALDVIETAAFAASDDEDVHGIAIENKMEVERLMREAPKFSAVDVALTAAACADFGMAELALEQIHGLRQEAHRLIGA